MSGGAELSYWLKRQLTAFEEKFDVADKDKSGNLSFEEVCEVLINAGFKGSESDMKVMLYVWHEGIIICKFVKEMII